jgi:hypothetical protein
MVSNLKLPIVYTLPTCRASDTLRADWTRAGIKFEERLVSESQEWLDQALGYGDMVPIIVHPGGRVEIGYKNLIG